MLLGFLAGLVTAFFVVSVVISYRHSPTNLVCPRCGSATSAVRREGLFSAGDRFVLRRWCQACGWEGVGRAGPRWVPGRPVAHDSGFHWGEERLPEDFGFRWMEPPPLPPPPKEPPHHPSGFRFASPEDAADSKENSDADTAPQGQEPPPPPPDHPSGFRWSRPRARGPVFRWGRGNGRRRPSN
ncbi:MAG: hypothetical protein ACE5GJ_14880 [Gemmatimonadota bacterium]